MYLVRNLSLSDDHDVEISNRLASEINVKNEIARSLDEMKNRCEIELSIKNENNEMIGKLNQELRRSKEENELSLLQLYQAQEEVEHYLLLSRKQSELLSESIRTQQKTAVLLSNVQVGKTE